MNRIHIILIYILIHSPDSDKNLHNWRLSQKYLVRFSLLNPLPTACRPEGRAGGEDTEFVSLKAGAEALRVTMSKI